LHGKEKVATNEVNQMDWIDYWKQVLFNSRSKHSGWNELSITLI
jgi:hypothetical protein